MKILSLFDGISCARIAATRAGIIIEKYYASEIDKYAIKISLKNYPNIIQLGDITKIKNSKDFEIDLLIGGSPCQDLSIARVNREGLIGSKSSLFFEYVRILNEIKPKYFILENVNSMPKLAKQTISHILRVDPIMINSSLVSAQDRKRLYWTNIKNIQQPVDKHIVLKNIIQEKEFYGLYMDYTNKCLYEKSKTLGTQCGKARSKTGHQVIIKPVNISKINKKGSQKENIYIIKPENGHINPCSVINYVRKITPIEAERLQTLPDNYTEGVSDCQRYKMIGNCFTVDVITHILQSIKDYQFNVTR